MPFFYTPNEVLISKGWADEKLILILVACLLSSPILASSGDVTIPATHLTLRSRGPPLNIFVRRWIVWRHVSMLGVSVSAARNLHARRLRTFFSVLPILALRIFFCLKKVRQFDKTFSIICNAFVAKWIYIDSGYENF